MTTITRPILIARNGSEVPIDDSAAPIHDASGKIVGVVLVFRDIAKRKQAERTQGAQGFGRIGSQAREPVAEGKRALAVLAARLDIGR